MVYGHGKVFRYANDQRERLLKGKDRGLLYEVAKPSAVPEKSILKFKLNQPIAFSREEWLSETNNEELDGFVLALAAIHNDLKSALFIWDLMIELKNPDAPAPSTISCREGEIRGIQLHAERLMYSVFCEFTELLEEKEDLLNKDEWKQVLHRLKPQEQKTWNDMVMLSLRSNKDLKNEWARRFKSFLDKVRGSLTYHYTNTKNLTNGLRTHFQGGDEEFRKFGFTSYGDTFRKSRFYYIDAAYEAIFNKWVEEEERDVRKEFRNILAFFLELLQEVVAKYMSTRVTAKNVSGEWK